MSHLHAMIPLPTFTGLPDEEMYVCVPGRHWAAVVGKLEEIDGASRTMARFYEGRKQQVSLA